MIKITQNNVIPTTVTSSRRRMQNFGNNELSNYGLKKNNINKVVENKNLYTIT